MKPINFRYDSKKIVNGRFFIIRKIQKTRPLPASTIQLHNDVEMLMVTNLIKIALYQRT